MSGLIAFGVCPPPVVAAQQQRAVLPALPALSLDSFPPAARAGIGAAMRDAAAHPNDADIVGRLGMVLHAWEQWQSAQAVYARAQRLAPQAAAWPYLDALVALRTRRAADAVPLLERVLTLDASSLVARMRLAEARLDAGDLTRSEADYAALVKMPAAEPEAEYGLGRIAAARSEWRDAIAHHKRACELFPEFGAAHYALALAYRNTGQIEEAQRELDWHRRFGPRWPGLPDPTFAKVTALKDDSRAHLERGLRLANDGKLDEAIAAHATALERDPANAQAHANLIILYGRQKDWTHAEEHFKRVLALQSNLDEAYYNYGVVLGLQNRFAEATDAFAHAIAVNPFHAQAHMNLGALLERESRWDDAAAEYRRAIESQPAFRPGRFNLARMLIALSRYDEAIGELERLRAVEDQESPRYEYALATAHLRAGHREEGLRHAQEARRLALAYDQPSLAAAIDKDLAALAAAAARRP